MRDFIIKMLGGITKNDLEKLKDSYSEFATDNLRGKNGEVSPDCYIYLPFKGDDILVLRSYIEIRSGIVNSLKIAPWCRNVVITGIQKTGDI